MMGLKDWNSQGVLDQVSSDVDWTLGLIHTDTTRHRIAC